MKKDHSKSYAVIFAGGMGSRMEGAQIPKQFLELGGKPIIIHTLEHFENHAEISGVVVVCVASWIDYFRDLVKKYHLNKILDVVPGGVTGQNSIFLGLDALNNTLSFNEDPIVLIHDGVRPLIDDATISNCITSVRTRGCTAIVAPSPETIIEVSNGRSINVLDRSACKFARAPQGFYFRQLFEAHLKARERNLNDFVDSISLMSYFGYPIYTVDGPIDNIKITSKQDFFAFKGYMDYKELEQLW